MAALLFQSACLPNKATQAPVSSATADDAWKNRFPDHDTLSKCEIGGDRVSWPVIITRNEDNDYSMIILVERESQ